MHPVLVSIGPLVLRTYSIIVELGILIGVYAAYRAARRQGIPGEQFVDMAVWTVIGGIVGSRLYYVVIAWDAERYYEQPLRIFASWEGGLVFQGAIIGGVLAMMLFIGRHRLPILLALDLGGLGMPIGHSVGRFACFFEGCCYGKPTDLPWGVVFPYHDQPVHPTMIYEAFGNLIIFMALWRFDKIKPFRGATFALYLMSYSTLRFLNEFLRGDPAQTFDGLRLAQWVCLGTFLIGALLLLYLRRSHADAQVEQPA
ncbi:MAG: prolipoprotein diacylglyceryl transferase [Chloroflexota bacterium]